MLTYLLAALTAFVIVLLLGPIALPLLHRLKFGQIEREEGPASHKQKQGTPTMGGLMFLAAIVIAALIFTLDQMDFVLPTLLTVLAFGLVGFLDDFIIVKMHRNLGLRAYQKMIAQIGISFVIALWAYRSPYIGSTLYVPFMDKGLDLGLWYIPAVMFVIIAETNAVNLTDGLDGLAGSVTLVYALAMAVMFAVFSQQALALGETLRSVNLGGMATLSMIAVGALLGYLRYNAYPAKVFMGDTGSLALGGLVSMLAICSRSILLLPVMGICFVGSALSVVLQVGSYKLRHGKRIFKMAPLHHHFELKGVHETKIVSMYTIVTVACCTVCLILCLMPA